MNEHEIAEKDYETIRNNLYSMLNEALDALEFAKEILKESEHPKAIDSYSGLLKNVATLNSQILELSKTYKDIIDAKNKPTEELPNTTNTNVFIGTTTDLQKLLKKEIGMKDITPNVTIGDS